MFDITLPELYNKDLPEYFERTKVRLEQVKELGLQAMPKGKFGLKNQPFLMIEDVWFSTEIEFYHKMTRAKDRAKYLKFKPRLFQIGSADGGGDLEWIAAETNIKAISVAMNTLGYSIYDIEEQEIYEIPREVWSKYHLMGEDGEIIENFEDYISRLDSAEVIGMTEE